MRFVKFETIGKQQQACTADLKHGKICDAQFTYFRQGYSFSYYGVV